MRRKNLICMVIALVAVLVPAMCLNGGTAARADSLSARDIVSRTFEMRKLDGSEGVSTLTIYNEKDQKRQRQMAMVSKLYDGGKTEKKLSRFLSPADVKGTAILTYDYEAKDDDMWMFLPSMHKTRRLVASEKSKSFMGSEFTYNDMNIPNLDDFSYRLLPEEKVDGVDCYQVEWTPRTEDIAQDQGYAKRLAWIGKTDFVVRRGVIFDLDGEKWKEMTVRDVRLVDKEHGKYRAFYMEMRNVKNRRWSTLAVDQLVYSPAVKDEYFTTRYLERQ